VDHAPVFEVVGWRVGPWRSELSAAVGSLSVVVPGVVGEQLAEVSLPEDQHPVGEFGSERSHESLGEAVRLRASRWNLHDADAGIGEHGIGGGAELAGRPLIRNRKSRAWSASSLTRLPACWAVHGPSGLAVAPWIWA
jgi:hypothetical protein